MRVEVSDVVVWFGAKKVLDRASAVFREGEVVALMGPSGAGKSTFLGVLAGAVPIASGAVSRSHPEASIEWMMQNSPLLQRRRVVDNVVLSAELRGVDPSVAMLRGFRAMRDIGILGLARARTFTLSGGEKQRVAVARAVAANAPLLLADEPTASLDGENGESVTMALRWAARSGAAVVIATHDEHVASTCDRVFEVDNGRIVERHAA